jgi:hypothetical protein
MLRLAIQSLNIRTAVLRQVTISGDRGHGRDRDHGRGRVPSSDPRDRRGPNAPRDSATRPDNGRSVGDSNRRRHRADDPSVPGPSNSGRLEHPSSRQPIHNPALESADAARSAWAVEFGQ